MKLERLESIPDEVDGKLFASLERWTPADANDLRRIGQDEWVQLELQSLALAVQAVIRVNEDGTEEISPFGVLNGIFRHYCPGYRLMMTESAPGSGENEPRRLWVCKEVE